MSGSETHHLSVQFFILAECDTLVPALGHSTLTQLHVEVCLHPLLVQIPPADLSMFSEGSLSSSPPSPSWISSSFLSLPSLPTTSRALWAMSGDVLNPSLSCNGTEGI